MNSGSSPLRLYHYFRSSSSWRVRWALELKKIPVEYVHVQLLNGESEEPPHRARNPMGQVPVLEFVDETNAARRFLPESFAILDYLESRTPSPSLYPNDPYLRAHAIALAEIVNSGTHPLQNLGAQFLHSDDPDERKKWARHWIDLGLRAFDTLVGPLSGRYCVGDELTIADLCLAPQVYNALRFEIDPAAYPNVARIHTVYAELAPYRASHPDRYAVPVL